jgi:hypothetical protein
MMGYNPARQLENAQEVRVTLHAVLACYLFYPLGSSLGDRPAMLR